MQDKHIKEKDQEMASLIQEEIERQKMSILISFIFKISSIYSVTIKYI